MNIKENKWNKHRNSLDKFFKLSNGQWLKIVFDYKKYFNSWYMDIVIAHSKRQCNDCIRKTELSPKKIYGHVTGNKLGIEALLIAKNELLKFENNISNSYIKIYGANERLINIYERVLKRYDYKTCFNERKRKYLMKFIRGKKK